MAERLSFSYPEEMKELLKAVAKERTRSMSGLVQIFIKEGLIKRGYLNEDGTPIKKINKAGDLK